MPKYTVHHSPLRLSGGAMAKAGEPVDLSVADAESLPYGTLVELTKPVDLRRRGNAKRVVEREPERDEPPAKPEPKTPAKPEPKKEGK